MYDLYIARVYVRRLGDHRRVFEIYRLISVPLTDAGENFALIQVTVDTRDTDQRVPSRNRYPGTVLEVAENVVKSKIEHLAEEGVTKVVNAKCH